jgi:hypothetical protein
MCINIFIFYFLYYKKTRLLDIKQKSQKIVYNLKVTHNFYNEKSIFVIPLNEH